MAVLKSVSIGEDPWLESTGRGRKLFQCSREEWSYIDHWLLVRPLFSFPSGLSGWSGHLEAANETHQWNGSPLRDCELL